MPNQQRFEGPDLEELLDEVRGRFGADVAIVEANKIRTGGVGGFFARELFEVIVDVEASTGASPKPTAPPPAGARSLLDLVDAVDDGPGPRPTPPLASEETVQQLLRRTDDAPVDDDGVAGLLARASQLRAGEAAPTGTPGPTMSTDGEAFAAVLDRIARSTQVDDGPAPEPDDEPFRSFAETAPTAPAERPATPPTPGTTATSRARRARTPARSPRRDAVLDHEALARLGLPGALLQATTPGTDRLSALLRLAERFPRADRLPRAGGTVVALVGDRCGMERAVAWVHDQLGLPPERLMLASRTEGGVFPAVRRIATYDDAADHRRSWRRTPRPTLVVVDEPIGIRGTTWARHVLDALEPSAVWAVVDAQRKPEDVVEWGERIGGIDAVALHRTAETTSPAAILATGLPVGLIDGETATPARWAAVLDERLLAA